MKNLLLEIGTEEIPAGYIPLAAEKIREIAKKKFADALLPHGEIKAFGSPRRLTLMAEEIPDTQDRQTKKISGPPKKAAVAPDGQPTKAGIGFCKKFGKEFKDAMFEETPKGEYLYLTIEEGGGKTSDLLQNIIPSIISEIPFRKTMRWGNGDMRFARPVRTILCLFGNEKLNFEMDGLKSGSKTFGHRFLSDGAIEISDAAAYEETLEKAFVMASPEKRIGKMENDFNAIDAESSVKVIRDSELMEEVCYLTENPVPVLGSFSKDYLDLPRELLITVMKHHQKYFAVEDDSGNLVNRFVAFSNILATDMDVVKKGFERVLVARLSDARFFFDDDRKHKLEDFAARLSGITYMKGLGNISDKVGRVNKIALDVADLLCPDHKAAVDTVSKLCKADLVTSMVFEFPELQGIMGREYAKAEGFSKTVSTAIDEHYRPRFSGDELPSSSVAVSVSLADKIETICGFFALGKIPSGSEDPFSLRRHALGIIRILLEKADNVLLGQLIESGLNNLPEGIVKEREKLETEILAFFAGRVKAEFTARDIPYDVVDAVLSAGFDSLPDALKRCEALAEMKNEDYSENISTAFKRAARIVAEHESDEIDPSAFEEEVERELFAAVSASSEKISALIEAKDFKGALREIAGIRETVDSFFEGVMVMAENAKIKENRLGLLRRVVRLFEGLADFSKLVFS